MVAARAGPSKLPLALLTLLLATAVRMSANVSPIAANACGLACTRTAGRWPPLMVTNPTPETCEIRVAKRVSAKSCN